MPSGRLISCLEGPVAKKKPKPKAAKYDWIAEKLRPLAVPVEDLHVDPNNARIHDADNLGAIEASLKRFGQVSPLIVNSLNGDVVIGNGRLVVARDRLGWSHVAVVWKELTEAQQRALSVADNRTAELAEWDLERLEAELAALETDDADLYGAMMLAELRAENPDAAEVEEVEPQIDRAAELQEKWGTERGQLWVIPSKTVEGGEHRVLCGDCRESADMARLCVEKVNGCFTSPPYAEQRKEQYGGIPAGEYVDWWDGVQAGVRSVLADDGSFFVNIKPHCEDGERSLYVSDLVLAMKRRWVWSYIDEFCWLRVGVPKLVKYRFKNAFEPIYHFAVKTKGFRFRPDSVMHDSDGVPQARGQGAGNTNWAGQQGMSAADRQGSDQTGRDHLFGQQDVIPGKAYPSNVLKAFQPSEALGHPAAYPAGLVGFFLRAYSDAGDRWLDPFLGSGTTLVAAEQLGRLCYGIEIEPKYVGVILERMADMGLDPERVTCKPLYPKPEGK